MGFEQECHAMIVNISEAKTQLSRLIGRVYHGEKVVIAKNNLPVAELAPYLPNGKRKLGILQGRLQIPDQAFFDSDTEIEAMFHGEPECELLREKNHEQADKISRISGRSNKWLQ